MQTLQQKFLMKVIDSKRNLLLINNIFLEYIISIYITTKYNNTL